MLYKVLVGVKYGVIRVLYMVMFGYYICSYKGVIYDVIRVLYMVSLGCYVWCQ